MTKAKRIVYRDPSGRVVHIGEWQYFPEQVGDGTFVNRNPLPDNYKRDEVECIQTADGGWYHAEDHSGLRRCHYPSLADQLDAFWKGGDEAEVMRKRVLAVKQAFPKSNKGS